MNCGILGIYNMKKEEGIILSKHAAISPIKPNIDYKLL